MLEPLWQYKDFTGHT